MSVTLFSGISGQEQHCSVPSQTARELVPRTQAINSVSSSMKIGFFPDTFIFYLRDVTSLSLLQF